MKHLITLSLAGLIAVPLLATSAAAHPAPFAHRHSRIVVHAPTVVVHRRVRRPRRRVIIRERRTVIVPERRTVIIRDRRRPVIRHLKAPTNQLLGVGVRGSASSMAGLKLGLNKGEADGPSMVGGGVFLKTKLTKKWGLELSVDALNGSGSNFTQTTVPVMASVTYNFLPNKRIQPYALAGVGANLTSLSYLGGKYKYEAAELAAQVGVGVEVFVTPTVSLQADVRAQTVVKNLDTQSKIREDCLNKIGSKTGFCGGINGANPAEKLDVGVTGNVGVNVYF